MKDLITDSMNRWRRTVHHPRVRSNHAADRCTSAEKNKNIVKTARGGRDEEAMPGEPRAARGRQEPQDQPEFESQVQPQDVQDTARRHSDGARSALVDTSAEWSTEAVSGARAAPVCSARDEREHGQTEQRSVERTPPRPKQQWLMDDTPIVVSLEPRKRSHRRLARRGEHTQNWTPQCVQKGCQEVSGVVHSARLCTTGQHSPSGTWLTTIRYFNSCPFHIHWCVRLLFVHKNLRFIEFVTGTLVPPVHLT